ncbi:MAG: beta-galactosidase [Oscillospiraceae bacterium]|nr:beta-galactosidase [Oscillospiraceae bacterium]
MNMIRFHHIDSLRGSLAPDRRSIIDYTKGHSKELCEEGIDKLDYIIYQLKIRGIYTHIDLFTLRMFLPGDGLDYPDLLEDKFEVALKNINWYNKRIQELHKAYIEQYLTHYNPYTKTRYVDEPAVAIIQMVNENSIFWDNRKKTWAFPSYRKELNKKWNQYLLDTYHTREELDKAWTNRDGLKALRVYEDPKLFNVLDPGLGFWNELRSEYDAPVGDEKSPVRIAEHKKFLSKIGSEYVDDMTKFMKDLGVKCCINVSNIPLGVAELEIVAKGDVTEKNVYWNHPQRDQELKGYPDVFHHLSSYNTSPLPFYEGERFESFKMNCISANSFGVVKGKPMVVTEWNVPHPTVFRPDVVMQMACYGALQDWDGMLLFEYTNQPEKSMLDDDMIRGYFTSCNDPAVWGLMALSSAIFQKGLVSVARNIIDIGYTDVDKFHQPDYMAPYRAVPFISRIRGDFIGDIYDGDADLAISSGFTASGDYTRAKHSLVYSRSPYSDFWQKTDGLDEFLNKHEACANSLVIRDGRIFDRDHQEFYRQFRIAMQKFGLVNQKYTMEDDEPMVSDTGELVYDYKGGKMTADTEQFNAFTGECGSHTVGNVQYEIDNARMCISVISRDQKPLDASRSILITAIGDCSNTGLKWGKVEVPFDSPTLLNTGEGYSMLLDPGHAPILIDPFRGSVTFKNGAENCTAYALNSKGERVESLKTVKKEDGWKIYCTCETTAMYYEVILD